MSAAPVTLQEQTGLLRFNTCGSVDDGKSTLIGRMLYEAKALFDDQLAALAADSTTRCCSTGSPPSASRESPSTSPTATSPARDGTSSSPTRPATSSTPATW